MVAGVENLFIVRYKNIMVLLELFEVSSEV